MSIKICVLEQDGGEHGFNVEMPFLTALYVDGLTRNYATQTAEISTGSTSFQSASVSFTPSAGTYLVIFNSELRQSVSGINNRAALGLYVGGSLQTDTERESGSQLAGISLASAADYNSATTVSIITVNGSQAIEGRYRVVTGSDAFVRKRSLVAIRIA